MLRKWENLPSYMRTDAVRPYYEALSKKRFALFLKRLFDLLFSFLLLVLFFPLFVFLSFLILCDSRGSVFYRQERVTRYGRRFGIYKFRTMIEDAEKLGSITVKNDARITKIGKTLRKYRLDELPQLINVFKGDMSFYGTRPESPCYVEKYTEEMCATLLLPAGVTSEASVRYKNESELLEDAISVDEVYIRQILPQKMKYNLESIKNFNLLYEFRVVFITVFAVLRNGRKLLN